MGCKQYYSSPKAVQRDRGCSTTTGELHSGATVRQISGFLPQMDVRYRMDRTHTYMNQHTSPAPRSPSGLECGTIILFHQSMTTHARKSIVREVGVGVGEVL